MRLTTEVEREATRLIRRHESAARVAADEVRRRNRRSTSDYTRFPVQRPDRWGLAAGFDPYLVRSRSTSIGYSLRAALQRLDYKPRPPVTMSRPKPGGGERLVSVYQVADSAISRMLFESVLSKNRALMSGRAYAYRKDLSAQDAIQYVRSEIDTSARVFVAEYDFSAFFDNIDRAHVIDVLGDGRFVLTGVERSAIESFLKVGGVDFGSYSEESPPVRSRGIPQGTAVSLVLANLAAWEIDRELERLGVGFVRYADDTLIWSSDYASICAAADVLHSRAEAMGVSINQRKSPGISLLLRPGTPPETGEMKSISKVSFLGYDLGIGEAEIKAESIARIKSRLEQLVFNNLLREPLNGCQEPVQLGAAVDRDYVTLLLQMRRYLYGDLTEKQVRRYQRGEVPFRRFKGLMAAYPMLSDSDQLRLLDGWLLSTLHLALQKRTRLLERQGFTNLPSPHGLDRSALPKLRGVSTRHQGMIDLSVPSFRRMATVIQRSSRAYGAAGVGAGLPYGY